ncbi:MAG: hypothetical protein WCT04_09710 [Planctomycetota bacterium]
MREKSKRDQASFLAEPRKPAAHELPSEFTEIIQHIMADANVSDAFKKEFSRRTVFCLPEKLVEALGAVDIPAKSRTKKPASTELDYEMELGDLCNEIGCVGWQDGVVLRHGYVAPEWECPFPTLTAEQQAALQTIRGRLDPAQYILTAFLGWLITDTTYLRELSILKSNWPLGAPMPTISPDHATRAEIDAQMAAYDEAEMFKKLDDDPPIREAGDPKSKAKVVVPEYRRVTKEEAEAIESKPGVIHLRSARMTFSSSGSKPKPRQKDAAEIGADFCRRWSLLKLDHWDLPTPLGIAFSDAIPVPMQSYEGAGKFFFVPQSLRHGENFNLAEWVNEECGSAPDHLKGWIDVLARRRKRNETARSLGIESYRTAFILAHFRPILESRYPGLGQGNTDLVLGRYLSEAMDDEDEKLMNKNAPGVSRILQLRKTLARRNRVRVF